MIRVVRGNGNIFLNATSFEANLVAPVYFLRRLP